MLPGKAWPDRIDAIAIGTVTGTAGYGLVLACFGIASDDTVGKSRSGKQSAKGKRYKLHIHINQPLLQSGIFRSAKQNARKQNRDATSIRKFPRCRPRRGFIHSGDQWPCRLAPKPSL